MPGVLNPSNFNNAFLAGAKPDGCYDSKVTNYKMALNMESYAISGPSLESGLKPFAWSQFEEVPHVGLPKSYHFPWVYMKPEA